MFAGFGSQSQPAPSCQRFRAPWVAIVSVFDLSENGSPNRCTTHDDRAIDLRQIVFLHYQTSIPSSRSFWRITCAASKKYFASSESRKKRRKVFQSSKCVQCARTSACAKRRCNSHHTSPLALPNLPRVCRHQIGRQLCRFHVESSSVTFDTDHGLFKPRICGCKSGFGMDVPSKFGTHNNSTRKPDEPIPCPCHHINHHAQYYS